MVRVLEIEKSGWGSGSGLQILSQTAEVWWLGRLEKKYSKGSIWLPKTNHATMMVFCGNFGDFRGGLSCMPNWAFCSVPMWLLSLYQMFTSLKHTYDVLEVTPTIKHGFSNCQWHKILTECCNIWLKQENSNHVVMKISNHFPTKTRTIST